MIIEYRNLLEPYLLQISYCFIGKIYGDIVSPTFTEKEINDEFELKWVKLEESIEVLKQDKPNNEIGKYIQIRDTAFLIKAKEIIDRNLKDKKIV